MSNEIVRAMSAQRRYAAVVAAAAGRIAGALALLAMVARLAGGDPAIGAFGNATAAACAVDAAKRPSHHALYEVALVQGRDDVAVGRDLAWRLVITGRDGEPVRDAVLSAESWMPETGHLARQQPTVAPDRQPGGYRLEGIRFDRAGWWNVRLVVSARGGVDSLAFNAFPRPEAC